MATLICQIKTFIEEKLDKGYQKFIIFPYGDVGIQVKQILNNVYGLQETYILDNHLWKYNPHIKALSFLNDMDRKDYCLLLSSTNPDIYEDLKKDVQQYFADESIAELSSMLQRKKQEPEYTTKIGKYSYGPICRNHPCIESIGAFCSFAIGTEVVVNHEINYLTTHPILYAGANMPKFKKYCEAVNKNAPHYFEGIQPKREKLKIRGRSNIGNDVWLGRNVIVANYANIGNGVIAGAGSIITRDIPDYAVVVGTPARIIRYRYSPEEIEALNTIAWWDWSDDEIRARYDDLYLPVGEFIRKYL